MPNSSENKLLDSFKKEILERSRFKPHPPASIISTAETIKPPSEISWKENILFLLILVAK